jgi:hypothetical protein
VLENFPVLLFGLLAFMAVLVSDRYALLLLPQSYLFFIYCS